MANYTLQNGNLTTFNGTSGDYNLVAGTSGQYAKSETQQDFKTAYEYKVSGSFDILTNQGIEIAIYDTNGLIMSNLISCGEAVAGKVTFDGVLVPTKNATGEIRIYVSSSNSQISNLNFTLHVYLSVTDLSEWFSNRSMLDDIIIVNGTAVIPFQKT